MCRGPSIITLRGASANRQMLLLASSLLMLVTFSVASSTTTCASESDDSLVFEEALDLDADDDALQLLQVASRSGATAVQGRGLTKTASLQVDQPSLVSEEATVMPNSPDGAAPAEGAKARKDIPLALLEAAEAFLEKNAWLPLLIMFGFAIVLGFLLLLLFQGCGRPGSETLGKGEGPSIFGQLRVQQHAGGKFLAAAALANLNRDFEQLDFSISKTDPAFAPMGKSFAPAFRPPWADQGPADTASQYQTI
ncbi:unnamed protein product [Polarella glacialis]|uniref:Transmembrane protein n=2 Tax=Polarella glacialis TaxID=89957 RepID=A0A813KXK7_POLGL|nr:unnamed protein product [Polarella glacialis]